MVVVVAVVPSDTTAVVYATTRRVSAEVAAGVDATVSDVVAVENVVELVAVPD